MSICIILYGYDPLMPNLILFYFWIDPLSIFTIVNFVIKICLFLVIAAGLVAILGYLKKRYPRINLPFLMCLFVYRFPFIYIYLNFLPGDWENYYSKAQYPLSDTFGIETGTDSLYFFTRPLVILGLSETEIFMIFSFLGYIGIVFFYLIGHRLTNFSDKVKVWGVNIFPWILLYPSLHMFTVMLGKDPLVVLGLAIVGYSLVFESIRKSYLVLGLTLLLIVRPHIMFVVLGSLMISLLWSNEWNIMKKFALSITGVFIAITLLPKIISFFRISELSLEAIQTAIELNAGYGDRSSTYIDMSSYPFPIKMFTYLFRPLFIDAPNAMLLVYSLENLIFLLLTISIIRVSFFQWIKKEPRIIKFCVVFTFLGTLVLSNGLSVFGLFMRQKTMVFLFLLLLIFAFIHDQNQKKTYRIRPVNLDLPQTHD